MSICSRWGCDELQSLVREHRAGPRVDWGRAVGAATGESDPAALLRHQCRCRLLPDSGARDALPRRLHRLRPRRAGDRVRVRHAHVVRGGRGGWAGSEGNGVLMWGWVLKAALAVGLDRGGKGQGIELAAE